MYVKLFSSILDSSIWRAPAPVRLLWITMLAMADEFGMVYASVGGLADRARLTTEECRVALDELMSADPDSQTETDDGRRVEKVARGWHLLNYEAYREVRSQKQMADAARQRRSRDKRDSHALSRPSVTRHDVTTTASASASAVDLPKQERTATELPARDPLTAVLAEAKLDLSGLDEADRAVIEGMLRGSRSPLARAVVLANALKEYTPKVVGRAFREFIASDQPWSTRLFGGFLRDAAKQIERGDNRERAKKETGHLDREAVDAENAKREKAEIDALLTDFERTHGEEFASMQAQAAKLVPPNVRGVFRKAMEEAHLVKMIRVRSGGHHA